MISKKYSQPLFMIFMSFGMSVIMSGVVTAVNTGVGDGFIDRYFNSLLFAFPANNRFNSLLRMMHEITMSRCKIINFVFK